MIREILEALDERTIARQVSRAHFDARLNFAITRTTVANYPDFIRILGQYYQHHFERCICRGGRLSRTEAEQRAKDIVERHYHRQGGDIVMAFNDAADGTNEGLDGVIRLISDALREEAVERYISSIFDRYVMPNSWPDRVELVRQFINEAGHHLSPSIDRNAPERYASPQEYQSLIRAYVDGLRQTSRIFRRL